MSLDAVGAQVGQDIGRHDFYVCASGDEQFDLPACHLATTDHQHRLASQLERQRQHVHRLPYSAPAPNSKRDEPPM